MIRLSRALILTLPCLAAAALAPSRAQACSPLPPGLTSSIPANGDSYPANAVLLFSGQEIQLGAVAVTVTPPVAGPSPKLVPVTVPFGVGGIAAVIEPAPPPGHTVEIGGDFCPPEYGCEPQAISFLVTAADQAAPAPPSGLSFDVYDYPDYMSGGGDCTSDSDLGYWVRASATPAADGESPVIYTITGRKKGSSDAAITRSFVVSDEAVTSVFRLVNEQIAGAAPAEAFCFEVTAHDTALNAAPTVDSVCLPCRYRAETEPAGPTIQPSEPAWTAADAYPGGPCKEGTGGGGASGVGGSGGDGGGGGAGGDDGIVGCGCELERPAHPAAPSLLGSLLLLTAARIRRRRRGQQ